MSILRNPMAVHHRALFRGSLVRASECTTTLFYAKPARFVSSSLGATIGQETVVVNESVKADDAAATQAAVKPLPEAAVRRFYRVQIDTAVEIQAISDLDLAKHSALSARSTFTTACMNFMWLVPSVPSRPSDALVFDCLMPLLMAQRVNLFHADRSFYSHHFTQAAHTSPVS